MVIVSITLLLSNVPPWRNQSRADTISIRESAKYRSRSGTVSFSASLASSIVKGSAITHKQYSPLSNPALQYETSVSRRSSFVS